jgi:hypothetical protein
MEIIETPLTHSQDAVLDLFRLYKEAGVSSVSYKTILFSLQAGKKYERGKGKFLTRLFNFMNSFDKFKWRIEGTVKQDLQRLVQLKYLQLDPNSIGYQELVGRNVLTINTDHDDVCYTITEAGMAKLLKPSESAGFKKLVLLFD